MLMQENKKTNLNFDSSTSPKEKSQNHTHKPDSVASIFSCQVVRVWETRMEFYPGRLSTLRFGGEKVQTVGLI